MRTTKNKMKFNVSGDDDRHYEKKVQTEDVIISGKEEFVRVKNDISDFVLIEASKFKLEDEVLKYLPFSSVLAEQIKQGKLKDFYVPGMDPSFDGKGGICYLPGERPAIGKDWDWWNNTAKNFKPEYNSRLGNRIEYIAFLAELIRRLITNEGWDIRYAVRAVCYNSRELGHYWNSDNAKNRFELTGSRTICEFSDLANTNKILARDEKIKGGFWLASGDFKANSNTCPLVDLEPYYRLKDRAYYSVGWIVLSL